ncbi:DUF6311 domain-containing protein [Pseudomonas sp. NBRC 111119]|uniref:DUF6311 domain-containing protein n=1 Tax=Pseudomonas sp. NBRC 111119 TaxID=1661034 RepID=UPI000761DD52|nr:DUF6311 domain-containing protein [Pseudomonas sp. NBRC 111119]
MRLKLDSTGRAGFAVALAIGVFFVLRHFPAGFVAGTSSYWQVEVNDVTQYFAGFNAFFKAPFSYPLLAFDSINYPQGTRATFVDVIPLYALLLKVFVPSSFAPFNPFGVWVALSFIGQAICAWWLLRELKVRSWMALLALVVCLLSFPALTTRLGHISLMSHWIILCALALYIRSRRTDTPELLGWTLLLVTSFYINIYLCVMASAIYVVGLLHQPSWFHPRALARTATPFVLIGISLFIMIFPMEKGEVAPEGGFGVFSMNLLSPFYGGKYLKFPSPEMPGQYEGFNYLGLGVLLAFTLAWVLNKRAPESRFAKHRALTWLMVLLTVYALSDTIYYGVHEVVSIHYPSFMDPITTQFRASGRFFWPVGYCVVLFAIACLYRCLGRKAFTACMLVLIGLQIADLSNLRRRLIDTAKSPADIVMSHAAWNKQLTADTQYLYFFPKFRCGRGDQVLHSLMPTMRYAAVHNLKINTGYVARAMSNCSTESTQAEIANSRIASSLYVFNRGDYPEVAQVKALFPADRQPTCTEVDFAHVCRLQPTGSDAQ